MKCSLHAIATSIIVNLAAAYALALALLGWDFGQFGVMLLLIRRGVGGWDEALPACMVRIVCLYVWLLAFWSNELIAR